MSELIVDRSLPSDGFEALYTALKASLGSKLTGLTGGGSKVTVLLTGAATVADQNTARQIVLTHDATQRTAGQVQAAQVQADFQEVIDKKAATALQQISSDLSTLPAADTAAVKQIVGRILQREQAIIKAFQFLASS